MVGKIQKSLEIGLAWKIKFSRPQDVGESQTIEKVALAFQLKDEKEQETHEDQLHCQESDEGYLQQLGNVQHVLQFAEEFWNFLVAVEQLSLIF